MGAPEGQSDPSNNRDRAADQRDQAADERDEAAAQRDRAAEERDREADERERATKGRGLSSRPERTTMPRSPSVHDERKAAEADRKAAAADRSAAARDRDLAWSAREQDAVERAESLPGQDANRTPGPRLADDAGEEPEVPDERVTLAGDPGVALTHGLDLVRRAVALSVAIADTEERVAQTLQHLGERGGDEALSERRLRLAREATQGARAATEHGERLQTLADRSAELAEFSTLQSLLHHAGAILVEVARTEQAIGTALERLAHLDDEQKERRLAESRDAARAAKQALRRAEELHRIAASADSGAPAAGDPAPEGSPDER